MITLNNTNYMNKSEYSHYVSVSRPTVYRMIAAREIKTRRLGVREYIIVENYRQGLAMIRQNAQPATETQVQEFIEKSQEHANMKQNQLTEIIHKICQHVADKLQDIQTCHKIAAEMHQDANEEGEMIKYTSSEEKMINAPLKSEIQKPTEMFQENPQEEPTEEPAADGIDTTRPLWQRKDDFLNALDAYDQKHPDKYSKEMYRQFFNYWSEHNENGRFMKFELVKRHNHGIWNLAGRLATWAEKDKQYKQNKSARYYWSPLGHTKADRQVKEIWDMLDRMKDQPCDEPLF